ncbi:alpha/beta fold hydrolase [Terricaulis sp.]|uniref:alpha/beta fold hydrolase n=1 Tax=Terricaulis sp. TaxID=2768686 RepID=UPI00378341A1
MKWLLGALLALVGLAAIIGAGGYFALKRDDIPYETLAARYESADSRYMDLPSGIRMHYRDQGAVQAPGAPPVPTILLIHGYSASLHTWEPWVARLSENYRVISIDLPGHGLTRAPAGYHANIENFRDAVGEFVQAAGLTRFAIAGNSMGGNVAWSYALAHPDQLDALILVDAAGWPHAEETRANDSLTLKLLRNPMLMPLLRDIDSTRLFRRGLEASFANPALATDAMVTRYTELSRAPGHRDILIQLQTGYAQRTHASNEMLAGIHTPTLILWGRHDNLIPVADAELFHAAIPGSEVKIFEESGHILQEDDADGSATAAEEFLYRIYEGGALAPAGAEE